MTFRITPFLQMATFITLLFCTGEMCLQAGDKPSVIADEAAWKTLESGKVAIIEPLSTKGKKDDCRQVVAAIIVDHSVKSVWDVIDDPSSAPEYIKDLKAATVIETESTHRLVEQKLKIGPLPLFTYVIKHETSPPSRVDFVRVSGDLKTVDGYWEFHPLEDDTKTLLIYSLKIAPGIPVPHFVLRNSMKKSLPDALISVKKRVNSLQG